MVALLTVVAGTLLVLGVVGSVVPALPAAVLSVAGVLLYWWSTGFADPSLPVLLALVGVGTLAAAVDALAGPLAAGLGGAAPRTVAAAAAVGLVMLVATGPVGGLLGLTATVFLLEFRRAGDVRAGARAAAYATVGVLGSAVVQVLLTGAMLVAFVVVVLV